MKNSKITTVLDNDKSLEGKHRITNTMYIVQCTMYLYNIHGVCCDVATPKTKCFIYHHVYCTECTLDTCIMYNNNKETLHTKH